MPTHALTNSGSTTAFGVDIDNVANAIDFPFLVFHITTLPSEKVGT